MESETNYKVLPLKNYNFRLTAYEAGSAEALKTFTANSIEELRALADEMAAWLRTREEVEEKYEKTKKFGFGE